MAGPAGGGTVCRRLPPFAPSYRIYLYAPMLTGCIGVPSMSTAGA